MVWLQKKKLAICFGFPPWKHAYIREYLPDYCLAFTRSRVPQFKLLLTLKRLKDPYEVMIWSYLEPDEVYAFLKQNNIIIHRIEDGFVRSVGLGSDRINPLSLVFDNDSLYFNPKVESQLELIIFEKAQAYTENQLCEAKRLIASILEKKLSKYNFPVADDANLNYLIDESKKTVLVIGQVEEDMSIKLGFNGAIDNLELVKLAYTENPNCNIIFKLHPDIFKGNRKNKTTINDYKKFSIIAPEKSKIHELIDISDHVYTITSLSGFEALMRRKTVTCLGMPFYSSWGLTDDRQKVERRQGIKLTLEQIFYAAYIEYPKYLNGSLDQTIQTIYQQVMNADIKK